MDVGNHGQAISQDNVNFVARAAEYSLITIKSQSSCCVISIIICSSAGRGNNDQSRSWLNNGLYDPEYPSIDNNGMEQFITFELQ